MILGELRAHIARHLGDYTNARTHLADTIKVSEAPDRRTVRSFEKAKNDNLNPGCAQLLNVTSEEVAKSVFSPFVDDTPTAGTRRTIEDNVNRSLP